MQHFTADQVGASPPEKSEAPTGTNGRGFRDRESRQANYANPWSTSNLGEFPPAWLIELAQLAKQTIAEHGADPGTRAQAAAHEAAHVVVAHSLGYRILGARLIRRKDRGGGERWEGCTRHVHPLGEGSTTARENPGLVLGEAANLIAGFCGEQFAGVAHPSSSLDERYKAQHYVEAVAAVLEIPPEFIALQLGAFCHRVLARSRLAFDTIRTHLARTRHITQQEARRMLASVDRETLE